MKTTFSSTLIAMLCMLNCIAQKPHSAVSDGNNEIKFNLLYAAFRTVELNYERIISEKFGGGIAANIWFDRNIEFNFMVTPFFRYYPASKLRASGFFIEANIAVVGYDSYQEGYQNTYTHLGSGAAIGGKFNLSTDVICEVFVGIGHIFGDPMHLLLYPRAGITLGGRF